MRFTATLAHGAKEDGGDDGDDRNLYRRVAKALAQLTGSPGALLMLPAASGGFRVAEQWHWPGGVGEEASLSLRSAFMLQETQHIVNLDAERRGAPARKSVVEGKSVSVRVELGGGGILKKK